ncbi:MAG: hypothetical protein J5673_01105 [Candidatus Methanomethylophilaceae archaeon]|nr:hypothetical protein [Candidatus Methanomethylophilaceae archaeon]
MVTKALKRCEKLTDEQRVQMFMESFSKVLDVTNSIVKDKPKALAITLNIVFYSVAADGKLVPEEFALVQFLLEKATGEKYPFSEVKKLIENAGDPNDQIDYIRKYFLLVDDYGEEAGVAFICLIMSVLSIDGDVSYREKKWMNKIF